MFFNYFTIFFNYFTCWSRMDCYTYIYTQILILYLKILNILRIYISYTHIKLSLIHTSHRNRSDSLRDIVTIFRIDYILYL